MPTYNHICLSCEQTYNVHTSIGNRDAPSICTHCGQEGKRNWSGKEVAPLPMQKSFADGHVPAGRKGVMREGAEAMRLKAESFNMKPEDRKEINREIRNLEKAKD